MEDNIDMNNHRIKGLSDGNENDDAVNIKQLNEAEDNLTKYIDNEITDNNTNINSIIDRKIKNLEEELISSVSQENVFKKVMNDNLFKEDDDRIKFISSINFNLLHLINHQTYLFQIEKDRPESYNCRLSIDLRYLPTGTYTMVFEMKFAVQINPNNVSVNAVSGTLNQVTTKTRVINFDYGYYSRSIINFHKWVINPGIDDLDIDLHLGLISSLSQKPQKTPINIIVYGVRGIHSDIPIHIWDRLYYYDDDHIKYTAPIDMGNKEITNIKASTNPTGAVTYKQLIEFNNYYEEIFEYWFDIKNPIIFNFDNDYDVIGINNKLVFDNPKSVVDVSSKSGFIFNCFINLDHSINSNNDFTIFISFQHTRIVASKITIGFWDERNKTFHYPHWEISALNVSFKKNINQASVKPIPSCRRYKQMALWMNKENRMYNLHLNNDRDFLKESYIEPMSMNADKIKISSSYYIQRTGINSNTSPANGIQYKKILFLEILNGMNKY